MKFTLEGNDCMPPVSGGYLIIYRGDRELEVISVPSPNLGADRYRDSVIENGDYFEDEQGNVFDVNVFSSNVGVDWSINVTTQDEKLGCLLRVEYHPNEF